MIKHLEERVIDMTGKKINNFIVLERDFTKKGKGAYWLCECQCENKTIKSISGLNLRGRRPPKSCGCLPKSKSKKNEFEINNEFAIGYTVKGEKFYFDKEDFSLIQNYYWYINSSGYPTSRSNKQ